MFSISLFFENRAFYENVEERGGAREAADDSRVLYGA